MRLPLIFLIVLKLSLCLPIFIFGQQPSSLPYNNKVGPNDWPQLGGSPLRNNASQNATIPTEWDVNFGKNIKWSVALGSECYGNVVVANGQVYVGTNNGSGYLERYPPKIDLGVMLCFRDSDGQFLWQYSSEKLSSGRVNDWPNQGICSSPVVEGDRLWFVTNRGEVVCLDANGFYDDEDDGPHSGFKVPIFDVQFDLSRIWESSITTELPLKIDSTLRTLVAGLAPADKRSYTFVKSDSPRQQLDAISDSDRQNTVILFHLTTDQTNLSISKLENAEEKIQFPSDLRTGLDERTITPWLSWLFRAKGFHLSEKAKLIVIEPGKEWILQDTVAGIGTTFLLHSDEDSLVCDKSISLDSKGEADVIWSFDMMRNLGVSQHNMANCSPTIWGDTLFVVTSNGVDNTHVNIPAPSAPSFIAMDKWTGNVLWTDSSPGMNILHGQWSSPAVGVLGNVPQVIFAGGDGWVYSFRADQWNHGKPILLWKFDGNLKSSVYSLSGKATRNGIIGSPVIHDGLVYISMGEDPEHGEGPGHLWCIDPTKSGDVSSELVVDESGTILPHQRIQANAKPHFLFQVKSNDWLNGDGGDISPAWRQQFERVQVSLTAKPTLVPHVKSKHWKLNAVFGGQERQVDIKAEENAIQKSSQRLLRATIDINSLVIPNPNSAVVWHYTGRDTNEFEGTFHRSLSTPVIQDDILYTADFSGLLHCLHAKTGQAFWTYDCFAAVWSSPMLVDGKVFIADEDGEVAIFQHTAKPQTTHFPSTNSEAEIERLHQKLIQDGVMINVCNFPSAIYTTPIVANNVLYIATRNALYAIEKSDE